MTVLSNDEMQVKGDPGRQRPKAPIGVGSVVRLRSGGPPMTVTSVKGGWSQVSYVDHGAIYRAEVPLESLEHDGSMEARIDDSFTEGYLQGCLRTLGWESAAMKRSIELARSQGMAEASSRLTRLDALLAVGVGGAVALLFAGLVGALL